MATATSTVTDVDIVEDRQLDIDEQDTVCRFVTATCGCNKGSQSRACSLKFTADYILSVRASCAELARHELDMAIMGQLACMNSQPVVGPARLIITHGRIGKNLLLPISTRANQSARKCFAFSMTLGELD